MNQGIQENEETIYAFETNGFVENPQASIAIATVCGMGLMFMTIMVGAPILISMVVLFAGILLVYGYRVGKVSYHLKSSGLEMRIRRFIPYWLRKKEETRFIPWKDVKKFKHDFDQNRSAKRYEYIKLYLNKSPGQIWITDENDASGFSTFRDTFLQIVALEHQSKGARKEAQIATEKRIGNEEVRHTHLMQKPSFYKTVKAKVLTILFMALAVTLLTFNEFYGLSLRHVYRLEFVIVPGVMYMIYRVFVKVKD